jgi:hypothetical protein
VAPVEDGKSSGACNAGRMTLCCADGVQAHVHSDSHLPLYGLFSDKPSTIPTIKSRLKISKADTAAIDKFRKIFFTSRARAINNRSAVSLSLSLSLSKNHAKLANLQIFNCFICEKRIHLSFFFLLQIYGFF